MKTKHTPGPWSWSKDMSDGKAGIYEGDGGRDDVLIAEVTDEETGNGTAIANANLIAAAPELLEALKTTVEDHQCAVNCNGPNYDCPCWYCQACAAIAKAEGSA
jgi:hypothetical protein